MYKVIEKNSMREPAMKAASRFLLPLEILPGSM